MTVIRRGPKATLAYNCTQSRRGRNTHSLLAIASLLTFSSVGLILSWIFIKRNHGFNDLLLSQNVLTYAPTLVLLVYVAIWRQIDYACKLLTPWEELKTGLAHAQRSVLLDYVSSFQLVAFIRSVQNRHVSVISSIAGFMMLKIAVIASTGLLILSRHLEVSHSNIQANYKFDTSQFNTTSNTVLQDESMLYTAYGLSTKGLKYPFGTEPTFAYVPFTFNKTLVDFRNSTFSTTSDAFFPMLDCIDAEVEIEFAPSNTTDQNPEHKIKLLHPGCDSDPGNIYALNPAMYLCPERQLSGTVFTVQCDDFSTQNRSIRWKLLTLTDIRYQQTIDSTQSPDRARRVNSSSHSTTIANITSVLCRPSYSIGSADVYGTLNMFPKNVSASRKELNVTRKLVGLGDDDLSRWVDSALLASADSFGRLVDNTYNPEYPNVMYKVMSNYFNGDYTSLLDRDHLKTGARVVFQHVAIQIASKYFTVPHLDDSTYSAIVSSNNLSVTESTTSLWIMVSTFLCTTLLAAVIYLDQRKSCYQMITCIPQSFYEYATLSTRSSFTDLLDPEQDTEGVENFKSRSNQYLFSLSSTRSCDLPSIAAVPIKTSSEDQATRKKVSGRWWSVPTASPWFFGLTFTFAILIIVILEVIQSYSDSHSGFLDLTAAENLQRTIISRYLPAFISLLLVTCFNCLDFNTTLMDQYNQLKASADGRFMRRRNPMGHIPVLTLWNSLRHARAAVVSSSVAAFAGTILTVVVAGLYTIEDISVPVNIAVDAKDTFDTHWVNSVSDDRGAAISLTLIENLNLSYPVGTFDEAAFPRLQVSYPDSHWSRSEEIVIKSLVPIHRAQLTCETADPAQIDTSISKSRFQQSLLVNSTYPLPEACLFGGSGGNLSTISFQQTFNMALDTNDTYFAKLLDLHMGPYDDVFGASQGETVPDGNADNPAGCPSLAFIYGHVSEAVLLSNGSLNPDLRVKVCYQRLQSLQANVTLRTANLTITEVSINEDTAKSLFVPSNGTNKIASLANETAYQFRVQKHFDTALSFFNDSSNPYALLGSPSPIVDGFFQGVFFGQKRIPIERLKLTGSDDDLIITESIQRFYRRYMAQALSANMRVGINLSASTVEQQQPTGVTRFDAITTSGVTRQRLFQHKTSKYVLQGTITLMILGGAIAVSITNYNTILPYGADPCTIWGQMRLWANSKFCEELGEANRETAECTSSKANEVMADGSEIHDRNILELDNDCSGLNSAFKLGWWELQNGHGVRQRRYGIDMIEVGS